jgi:hypothetical protein
MDNHNKKPVARGEIYLLVGTNLDYLQANQRKKWTKNTPIQ